MFSKTYVLLEKKNPNGLAVLAMLATMLFALPVLIAGTSPGSNDAAAPCGDSSIYRGTEGGAILCEAKPVTATLRPMPAWWLEYPGSERLSSQTLHELDDNGLRPMKARP